MALWRLKVRGDVNLVSTLLILSILITNRLIVNLLGMQSPFSWTGWQAQRSHDSGLLSKAVWYVWEGWAVGGRTRTSRGWQLGSIWRASLTTSDQTKSMQEISMWPTIWIPWSSLLCTIDSWMRVTWVLSEALPLSYNHAACVWLDISGP